VLAHNWAVCNQADSAIGRDRARDAMVQSWVQIVRGEYLEIPGLSLTRSQVQRFWGFDAPTCERVLDALTGTRFLRRTHGDEFVRVEAGH